MTWKEWLISAVLLFMMGLLIAAMSSMMRADTCAPDCGANGEVCIINTPTGRWCTPPTPAVSGYEWEDSLGVHRTTTTNEVLIPPPDRNMQTLIRLRVRWLKPGGSVGEWSPWNGDSVGVPVGYDSDWDRDGEPDPLDFDAFLRVFQGYKGRALQWPR